MKLSLDDTIDLIESESAESGYEISPAELGLLRQFLVLLDIAAAGHNRELFVSRVLDLSPREGVGASRS